MVKVKGRVHILFLLCDLSLAQLNPYYALVFDVQVIPRGTSRTDWTLLQLSV